MSHPRFLIADGEYIIAMEAERLLRELCACEVAIVNPGSSSDCAGIDGAGLSLALIDTGFRLDEETAGLARRLLRQGVAVAFTTANAAYLQGVPGFPGTPVLGKPYDPARFAELVLRSAAPGNAGMAPTG